jgi:hypothetical protein
MVDREQRRNAGAPHTDMKIVGLPGTKAEMVNVHKFEMWDQAQGIMVISDYAATREAIAEFQGVVIANSERKVDSSLLDDLGRVVIK